MASGDKDLLVGLFLSWFLFYWVIFEIDFMLMTCFPLRAYRLGMKTRKFFRTKELYQDVIRYFENRCSCCNVPECCWDCEYDEDCKDIKCCIGILYIIKLFIVFTVGIVYWIILFPFLLLPLGCDCVYECELRSKYPIQCKDCCYDDKRGENDDNEVMQPLDAEDGSVNNSNSAQNQGQKQIAVQNKNKQSDKSAKIAQPNVSNPTPQNMQTSVYQQSNTYLAGPAQAQQYQPVFDYQQSNPYASDTL